MYNIKEINVPEDIEYISEWNEFEYPQGHLILDKTICGCGFTEYCLTNNIPIILCSPRKTLLQNKKEQHPENNVYHFRNGCTTEVYDTEKVDDIDIADKESYLIEIKERLKGWLMPFTVNPQPAPKILVTYDSLHHVLSALGSRADDFAIVVDEFQSIFMDAAFKADIEMDFIEELKNCKNVLYLSATPMLDKYLCDLDYFKDLDFYKLVWPKSKIENVRIERHYTRSILESVSEYVERYRNKDFPTKFVSESEIATSQELVIFVNSIKTICDLIRKCKLKPEETNIICANTKDNVAKLKKKGHEIGSAPLKGEQHKMFTLCTRTVYLGADFYSTSALTLVCSDANIKTLMVDISLDLPQIIGRQRLKENVFRNEVIFLYKSRNTKDATINITEEEYQKKLDEKTKKTTKLLAGFDKMTDEEKKEWTLKASRDSDLYIDDFLGVSKKSGKVVFNNLVKIADQRAYEVSRKDYQDKITIKRSLESIENYNIETDTVERYNEVLDKFLEVFNNSNVFTEKMELLCELVNHFPDLYKNNKALIPLNFQNYIDIIGPEKCKALCYVEGDIKKFIEDNQKISNSTEGIINLFEVGKTYTKAEIKEMLKKYYSEAGIKQTPKASDILNYFDVSDVMLKNKETGKRDNCYKILKRK